MIIANTWFNTRMGSKTGRNYEHVDYSYPQRLWVKIEPVRKAA
jgi:hypothetical protein